MYRTVVRLVSALPKDPRCKACGSPFAGWGGAMMHRMGKAPSRKNPRWCRRCFEMAPEGGAVLTIGTLFADVRGFTAMTEAESPVRTVQRMNRFYGDATRVIVQHGIVDKLIGDEVMGLYIPGLTADGRYVDAMVADAITLLKTVGYGTKTGPTLQVGIGLAVGPAFVGILGEGEVRDFTALGDVVNVAARLQGQAKGGEIVMTSAVAEAAGVAGGFDVTLVVKGKSEPVLARTLCISQSPTA
jgi:adenylate cyclase